MSVVPRLRVCVVVCVAVAFILPLCSLRKVSQLRFSSFIMLICIIYLVMVVTSSCLFGAVDHTEKPIPGLLMDEGRSPVRLKDVNVLRWDATFLKAVPIFVFSFHVRVCDDGCWYYLCVCICVFACLCGREDQLVLNVMYPNMPFLEWGEWEGVD